MTWIDKALSRKQRDKGLRDRQQKRRESEHAANARMSWRAWPEVVDEVAQAVQYFNDRVEKRDRILLSRENERELEASHKRRPSLRMLLTPESRTIKCEIAYRERGWDSDTLYIKNRLGGFSLLGRDGNRSLKRSIRRWIQKLIEDIQL